VSARVLMLITQLGQGGAERVFHEHAQAFAQWHEVEEVVFEPGNEALRPSGLPLHVLDQGGVLLRFGPPGRLLSRALALRRLVREREAALVVSHMDGPNWVNALSLSTARKLLVVHGSILHDRRQHGWRQWLRRLLVFPVLYNLADRTVAVSQGIARELRGAGVRRVEAIENFFPVAQLRAQAAQPPAAGDLPMLAPPLLVSAGRLDAQKNQAALFPMLRRLRTAHPTLRLLLLGEGPLRGELEAAAAREGLRVAGPGADARALAEAEVLMPGYRDNPFCLLRAGSLFVFPSSWEGFPLALCEAMAVGVPVASADCPTGPREILAPGTQRDAYDLAMAEPTARGLLLPRPETEAAISCWVAALDALLHDATRREAMAASAGKAIEALDRERVLGRWRALLDALLPRAGAATGAPDTPDAPAAADALREARR
jgi:glycosyltransferase involved in cell wall biosynthesis